MKSPWIPFFFLLFILHRAIGQSLVKNPLLCSGSGRNIFLEGSVGGGVSPVKGTSEGEDMVSRSFWVVEARGVGGKVVGL